jgi:WD40 repeat protein
MPYKAFLSYSHAEDAQLASSIQEALHRFARPWYKTYAVRVFRDKTGLSANPALWDSIARALADSEFLLLLASPLSKASPWVTREIEAFLATRSADKILIVLTRGEIVWNAAAGDFDWARTTALPDCLRGRFADQPLYVDLTWAAKDEPLTLRQARFRDAILDLAAPLHGKRKDELDSEDLRQHRRTMRLAWSVSALLAVLALSLGIAAVYAWVERNEAVRQSGIANEQRRAAEEQRRQAELRRQEADRQRQRAEDERQSALSRQLAAQALGQMSSRLDLGILQSVQALAVRDTREARSALLASLFYSPQLDRFLWNEPGTLKTAALSGDGAVLLALLEESGTLRLQSVSPNGIRTLRSLASRDVTALALTRDARLIAVASHGRVTLRDARTLAAIGSITDGLADSLGVVGVMAWSPDGTRLAAYDPTASVLLWDTAQRALSTPPLRPKRWETALAWSPDNRMLASGGQDGSIVLWDTASGRAIGSPLPGHSSKIFSLLFSPDGQVLASSSEDRTIRLWDPKTGRALGGPLIGHEPWALGYETWGLSLAWSPDGLLLASAGKDRNLFLWNLRSLERRGSPIRGHATGVVAIAFSRDGRSLISVGQDGTVAQWRTDSPGALATTFEGLGDGTVDLSFSADGSKLAAASLEKIVRVWDVNTRQELRHPMEGFAQSLVGVAFTPAGDALLSGTRRQLVEWNLSSARRSARTLAGDGDEISSMVFSPDRSLVAASDSTNLLLLDRATGRLSRLPVATASATHEVSSLAFSADGQVLASGARDGTIAFWNAHTGRLMRAAIKAHREGVGALAFSRDGKTIASAGVSPADFDPNVRLWDTATGRQLLPALGGQGPVSALTWSPDGQTLAVADLDRVALWHVESRQQVGQPLKGHAGPILSLAFSPDGRWLASGGHDDRVLLWDLRLESWLGRACSVANRQLSEEEWTRLVGDVPYQPSCRN